MALSGARVQAQSANAPSANAQAASAALPSTSIKPVARITQAIDEAKLVPMHNKVHPLARPQFDRGLVADSQPMNRMMLVLKRSPDQEAALRALMDDQQTKNSPNYHAWLTPAQFGQQFGVADADVQKVTSWLAQKGFTGIKVAPSNMFIEFSGTAGAVRNAFHTEIHQFMVKGEMHMANVSVPQMPAALASVVSGVHSLHNFRKKSFMHFAKPQAISEAKASGKLGTEFTATPCTPLNAPTCIGVGPADFAKIYNLPANLDGTGQTIALVARSNINVQDVIDFRTGFGLPNNFSAANIILASSDPGIVPGDDAEPTLDAEWSGAVAPGANILLVVADGTLTTNFNDGVDLSALYIIQNNLAPIMSESFGLCEAFSDNTFDQLLWEQAAAQGITVMVSSGDNGSAGCDPDQDPLASTDGLNVSGTASTPFNVAVGGTDFDDANNPSTYWTPTNTGTGLLSAKSYIPEIPWNDTCASAATIGSVSGFCTALDQSGLDLVAGSGGPSAVYGKPSWQALTIPGMPNDSARDIPDVSLFASVNSASNNFYIICLADSLSQNGQPCSLTGANLNFSGVGGTSASSPAFAGIIALVNQSEVTAGRLKAGEGQGNVNYVLYPLAAAQATSPGTSACNSNGATPPNAACVFNDVTKGNNSVACDGGFGALGCSVTAAGTTGILLEGPVPPYTANAPAWAATAGYDLATGLGSVNVTKLVGSWGSVVGNFSQSTTSITAPAPGSVNITHGANVNFTAAVAQVTGAVKPTGDVSLIAKPTTGPQMSVSAASLLNGTVSLPTNFLPGGTYPVFAHYAGDGTFAASDSPDFTVTVAKEGSAAQTTLGSEDPVSGNITSVTTVPYGSLYLFRTDVLGTQNGDNQVCANIAIPCPTGTITVTDGVGGAPIKDFPSTATGGSTNVATLNVLGLVEDRVLGSTGLPAGSHHYTATYSGDISYNAPAQPGNLAFTITPASTLTSVTAGSNQSSLTVTAGQSVTLVATVSGFYVADNGQFASNGAGPTGTVTFSSCGTAGSCTVNVVPTAFTDTNGDAFATGTLTTTFTTAGVQTITATFTSADGNYNSCTVAAPPLGCSLAPLMLTVNSVVTGSFTLASTPVTLSSATGTAVGSTITVTPSGGFTGNVVVTASTLPPGVTCPNSPLTINVTAANPVQQTLNCQVTAHSTTLTASNFLLQRDGMLEAKAIPAATGEQGNGKGWWALSAGTGLAALSLFFLPGGRKRLHAALGLGLICLLTLTIGCNGVNGNGGGGGGLTATTTQLTVTSGTEPSGTAFTFSVAVTGGTPTGMVQLFDGATAIGTAAAVSGGKATPTAPALSVGTHAISAHYLGDSTTQASQSGSLNLTSTGATQVAITTNPTATPAASPITVTVQ